MVVEKLTMSPSVFSFVTTIILGPLAALVGGIVVAWSTQDYGVGVIAGIAGLAAGLVVGYLITGLWMARWPTEYDPVDKETWERAKRRYDESDKSRPWTKEESAALNEVQSAMLDLWDAAECEHRDPTALEKKRLKRLEAKQSEMFSAHEPPYGWTDAIWTVFFVALFFGGTATALVVTLAVGWLMAG